jgi:hypothetical protein
MTSTARFHAIDSDAGLPARLRAADIHAPKMVSQAAGPFEVPADTGKGPSMRDALITGLLVIYPTVATLVAIVAGLVLANANGT